MGTSTFAVSSSRDLDCVTVVVAGDVDLLSVATLRRCIGEALIDGCRMLVIDLSEVTFIDSAGLGALVAAWKRARVLRVEMVVWRPSHPVLTVLGLTALDHVLHVDVRDAHPAGHAESAPAG
ncbi:MAG: anti-sigma-factor antagonist [Nocardioides sp.]|nr:anti-sigma-factor antagonist [Nocardioides sp.]